MTIEPSAVRFQIGAPVLPHKSRSVSDYQSDLPWWGLTPSASASLGITGMYFVISFARSWAIREAFRKWLS